MLKRIKETLNGNAQYQWLWGLARGNENTELSKCTHRLCSGNRRLHPGDRGKAWNVNLIFYSEDCVHVWWDVEVLKVYFRLIYVIAPSGWKLLWLGGALTWVSVSAEMEASSRAWEELDCGLIVRKRKGIVFHNICSSCGNYWSLIFMINSQRQFSCATYPLRALNTHHHLPPGTIK